MVVRKHKKITKQRGSRTCGWGLVHRGSGQKGGVGNSAGGKKCHAKKQSFPADHFGKRGFKKKGVLLGKNNISIRDVEEKLNSWNVPQENGLFVVDLKNKGYDKLVSQGNVKRRLKIIVKMSSKKAQEKIKASSGEVILG
ncbi:uL15 family ribosomal protein [Candidatus Woesearchaeota archaeon]|nr:uL15 family ribosomal protein [Candidatus Woesearchaeota archaeon]